MQITQTETSAAAIPAPGALATPAAAGSEAAKITIEWDAEGRLREWSDGARLAFGWDPVDVIGLNVHEVPFLLGGEVWRAGSALAMARDEHSINVIRLRARKKDGTEGYFQWRNCMVRNGETGATTILSSIHELRNAAYETLADHPGPAAEHGEDKAAAPASHGTERISLFHQSQRQIALKRMA